MVAGRNGPEPPGSNVKNVIEIAVGGALIQSAGGLHDQAPKP